MSLFDDIKDFFKTGRLEILPKIDVSDEIKNKVSELVEYVYSKGEPPVKEMPSKKYQKNLLSQVYAMTDLKQYENLANTIYENVMTIENAYAQINNEDELFEHMHFAMENLCFNIIRLSKNKDKAREYWDSIDNMTQRLLQMNHDKFKELFIIMHEWHFGWVYEFDYDYKYEIKHFKDRLKHCHGIKQTDFYKRVSCSKTDAQFVLYFGEKAGEIKRVQDGKTYRLYLPEDNVDEIPKYEFTGSAASDGCFDYKQYWKEITKKLKGNEGILQTEFYKLFDWDSEVLTRTLRDAEKDNAVVRKKKGNSYLLYLP